MAKISTQRGCTWVLAPLHRALGPAVVMALALGLWPSHAVASQAMAQRYACTACHQPAATTAGPSWKDIAARYAGGKGTAEQLASRIKAGSSGKWGAMPMPPQAQVPEADAQALAQWILDAGR